MSDEEKKEDDVIEAEDMPEVDELDAALGGNEEEVEEEETVEDNKADGDDTKSEKTEEKPAEEDDSSKQTEPEQVDDSLIERAVKVGIPMNMAKYSEPEVLEEYIASLEEKAAEKPAEPDTSEETEPYKTDLDPEKYDEGVIAEFEKVGKVVSELKGELKALKAENETLKGNVESTVKSAQAEAQTRAINAFDEDVAGLGDDFKELVGEGGIDSLKATNKTAFDTRLKILDNLVKLKDAMPEEDHPKLFNMAVYNVTGRLPGEKAAPAEDPIPEKLKEQAGKTVGKPGGGKTQNNKKGEVNQLSQELDSLL